MRSRFARMAAVGVLVATGLAVGAAATRAAAGVPQHTITLHGPSYTPRAPNGATDDYHCTLVDPHVTTSSFIVGAQFVPNSPEVHHAILFLIPPDLASTARADDQGGRGWTCFGESALPDSFPSLAGGGARPSGSHIQSAISNTPWLTAWAPGHGAEVVPTGTGTQLPAGSLVVMQIHYNLLRGDRPVRSTLVLHTVPASTPLQPLDLSFVVAPPDVPCPTGVTGPLCSRAAQLASVQQRFGASQAQFDNILEMLCGRDPANPPQGTSTSCTLPTDGDSTILQVTAHMHLTGRSMQVVLNPGKPNAQILLDVTNYNFDYQKTYTLAHPVITHPGDTVGITCTYDPNLAQELPQLRKLAPHYTVWADGSSDEMCLAILGTVHGSYKR